MKASPTSAASALKRFAKLVAKVGVVATGLCVGLVAYGTLYGPVPEACVDAWPARLEYNVQLFLTMTTLQTEWNLPRMFQAMQSSCKFEKQEQTETFSLAPLPEIDALHDAAWRDKLRDYIITKKHAVVVRNFMAAATDVFESSAKAWGLDFLENQVYANGAQVPVFMDSRKDDTMEWMPFADLAAEIRARRSTSKYGRCLPDRGGVLAASTNSAALATAMHKELEHWFTKSIGGGMPHCLFVSSNLVRTRMHSDTQTNAFLMIEGRKRWTFFGPSESMYLLPSGQGFNLAYNSLIDVFARHNRTQQDKFPLLRYARGFETVINAGDVAFHPAFWWHAVENLDDVSIGMDVPFIDPLTGFKQNPVLNVGTVVTPVVNPRALSLILYEIFTSKGSINFKELFFANYYQRPDVAMADAYRSRAESAALLAARTKTRSAV